MKRYRPLCTVTAVLVSCWLTTTPVMAQEMTTTALQQSLTEFKALHPVWDHKAFIEYKAIRQVHRGAQDFESDNKYELVIKKGEIEPITSYFDLQVLLVRTDYRYDLYQRIVDRDWNRIHAYLENYLQGKLFSIENADVEEDGDINVIIRSQDDNVIQLLEKFSAKVYKNTGQAVFDSSPAQSAK